MKFKIGSALAVVLMALAFSMFSTAVKAQTASSETAVTVTAEQVKAANDKFIQARNEYQQLVKSGAEKSLIEAAYVKFMAARDEYQKLNQAAGNCIPGSGQGASGNNGKGNGQGLRDGSCAGAALSASQGSSSGSCNGTAYGNGKGRR